MPATTELHKLREQTFAATPHKVDRDKGIIHGVKILGNVSRNGYSYSANAIQEAAKCYEGLGCYIDHSYDESKGGERAFGDLFGRFESVTCNQTEARGDLHFLKSHAYADRICEAAERFPESFGMSHEAYSPGPSLVNGEQVIESIRHVSSIDIVTSPATNKGLFESIQTTPKEPVVTTKTPVKTSIRKLLEAAGPKGVKVLTRLREGDPSGIGLAGPSMLDAPLEVETPAEDASPEDMMEQARDAQVIAVLNDKKLDVPAKLKAIEALLTAHGDIQTALSGGGDTTTPPPGDTPVSESVKFQARIAELEKLNTLRESREEARKLLKAAEVDDSEIIVEAVALLESTKRPAFIEALPKRPAYSGFGQRPETSAPFRESAPAVGSFAEEAAAFAKRLPG